MRYTHLLFSQGVESLLHQETGQETDVDNTIERIKEL